MVAARLDRHEAAENLAFGKSCSRGRGGHLRFRATMEFVGVADKHAATNVGPRFPFF
jgi:hypothetical protein